MPDITMCKGVDSEKCNRCYRKVAIPNPHRQSYFSVPPMQKGNLCTWFSEVRDYDTATQPHTVNE